MTIELLCWYKGVCKPSTESVEDENAEEEPEEREESFKHD
jgi:hypothetical protein